MTDGLTGLTLRQPFMDTLASELARAGRSREPVSILMLDVDHFKAYNDTFGHTAGDVILKHVAKVLRSIVPPGGAVGRYGGEEFVVLLPRMTKGQGSEIAEAIRRTVEQRVALAGGHDARGRQSPGAVARKPSRVRGVRADAPRTVTVSIGVAAFPDDAKVDLELIRAADQRLYQAKHNGRNLVCTS